MKRSRYREEKQQQEKRHGLEVELDRIDETIRELSLSIWAKGFGRTRNNQYVEIIPQLTLPPEKLCNVV